MDILYSSNSIFTTSSSYGSDLSYLYDDNLETFGYLPGGCFAGADGKTTYAPGHVLASIEFTDGTHERGSPII